jgi:hypothetical protein
LRGSCDDAGRGLYMGGNSWHSRESELISKYADRLVPTEPAENKGGKKPANKAASSKDDEVELNYMNGAPPRDLLNYKNMDLEMSLWAKTGTGWMSLGVLVIFMFACFIIATIMWILHIGV